MKVKAKVAAGVGIYPLGCARSLTPHEADLVSYPGNGMGCEGKV